MGVGLVGALAGVARAWPSAPRPVEESGAAHGAPAGTMMPGPPPITRAEIEHRFRNHPPVGGTGAVLDDLTASFIDLGVQLAALLPEGREKSTAITKLEEVSMWSKAAVARNQGEPS